MRPVVSCELDHLGVEQLHLGLKVAEPSADALSDGLGCVTRKVDLLLRQFQQQLQSRGGQVLNLVDHQVVHAHQGGVVC